VQTCDLLIVLGARFDDRATGKLASFAPHARVVHVDVDAAEIGKLREAQIAIVGDLTNVLPALHPHAIHIEGWRAQCDESRREHAFRYDAPGDGVYAPALLKELSERAGDSFVAACDVGQHQMWAAQHCRFSSPFAHLTSGGLGAMGYGVPAGIGAKLARPDAHVVTITGDGSFLMNVQELATLKRYGIALKILLLDNSSLGLVRQWQELFFDRNFSEIDLSDNPDFAAVAQAFGIEAFRISRREEVSAGIERLLAAPGPCLAHVVIDAKENVWPLVPPGKSNSEMMLGEPQ
jgi:acetolactate synthase-1/2/3 large subunit